MTISGKDWEPVEGAMLTRWGRAVEPDSIWSEYPRPQLVRDNWLNLNGLWQYAVTGSGAPCPAVFDGNILVPFSLESPMSGVGRKLEPKEILWYRREVELDPSVGKRILLNFEAVDYACNVQVNGHPVGSHRGGNLPFSLDITTAVVPGNNELLVSVEDSTDSDGTFQLHGKQRLDNRGIFYTRVSGIWQTVWIEQVPESHIKRLTVDTRMDGRVSVTVELGGTALEDFSLKAFVSLDGRKIESCESDASGLVLQIDDPQLWSPDHPLLYDLILQLRDAEGLVLDTIESYFGIREVGRTKGDSGELVFTLNGESIFHWGVLDQGWWPDGLLTPPSEEAIAFELTYLKEAGFNMVRKHVKVEPRRYYTLCDRMGILVWQDHVPGGTSPKWKRLIPRFSKDGKPVAGSHLPGPDDLLDADWPDAAHEQFMLELSGMLEHLHNHPSIVVWVPFNERWGQHRTREVGEWIESADPSRLINIASGGNFFPVGDIADEHDYPDPNFPMDAPEFDGFIKVVGEFGGHGYAVAGHLWNPEKGNWGYGGLPQSDGEYLERYVRTARLLGELRRRGIAAGVYTQTSDVEGEINGLMTYDREVLKIPADTLKGIHQQAGLIEAMP